MHLLLLRFVSFKKIKKLVGLGGEMFHKNNIFLFCFYKSQTQT